jgi:hypothetical protein
MTRRIVLSPNITRRQFEDYAFDAGWRLHQVVDADQERPYEEIWAVDDGQSAVHYIEDELLGLLYVIVMGENARELDTGLRRGLDTVRPEVALGWLEDATWAGARVQAVAYLAAAAEQPAPDLIHAFDRLMRDPDADVRRAALFAATYPRWPELLTLIRSVAKHDTDSEVRAVADQVAQVLARDLGDADRVDGRDNAV